MSPPPRSATDNGTPGPASAGECFARALAAKDAAALCALLADQIDFQALTPGRHWQAGTAEEAVREIILARWFGEGDDITELCSVTSGRVLDREHVAYRVRVRRSGRDHLVEQQAYYLTNGPRITWMRVLCSGYQPVPA
jgi:ketosteroid isomerase-like protein